MAKLGEFTFDWITDAQVQELLGKSRPKTLKDIEKDDYWGEIFGQWVGFQEANGFAGIQAIYDRWRENPDGPERDALKNAGNDDVRKQFYDDLGTVKTAARLWDRQSGAAEKRIDDIFGLQ